LLLGPFQLLVILVLVSWWRTSEWPNLWEVAFGGYKGK